MDYRSYGISAEFVERMKRKAKQPAVKERLKAAVADLTKADLQNPAKIRQLIRKFAKELGEPVSSQEAERIVKFVIDQKIDPHNTFHLIRLWSMFH